MTVCMAQQGCKGRWSGGGLQERERRWTRHVLLQVFKAWQGRVGLIQTAWADTYMIGCAGTLLPYYLKEEHEWGLDLQELHDQTEKVCKRQGSLAPAPLDLRISICLVSLTCVHSLSVRFANLLVREILQRCVLGQCVSGWVWRNASRPS